MKKAKIRGYLKDLENKNKNFSYEKTMKIIDICNYVYLDMIKNFDYKTITNYKKSKYIFKEIVKEFEIVYNLISEGNVLMGACLLRNIYEEILYIMATSLQINLNIDIMTKAGYFKEKVIENSDFILGDSFDKENISELYSYLSKITHVTNIKEATSYLAENRVIKKYIVNEMKYIAIIIECLYLEFLYKKTNVKEDFIKEVIIISSYVELINAIYFAANSSKSNKQLEIYFYGEKNQKYLKNQQEKMIAEFKNFKVSENEIKISIKKALKNFEKKLIEKNYIK